MVEPEARQAGVDLMEQMITAAAAIIGPVAHGSHALGGDDDLVSGHAERLEGTADERLTLPGGVEVRGVDEVDARFERLPYQRGRCVLIEIVLEEPARLIAESHGPEAQFGNDEAGLAEPVVAHRRTLPGAAPRRTRTAA